MNISFVGLTIFGMPLKMYKILKGWLMVLHALFALALKCLIPPKTFYVHFSQIMSLRTVTMSKIRKYNWYVFVVCFLTDWKTILSIILCIQIGFYRFKWTCRIPKFRSLSFGNTCGTTRSRQSHTIFQNLLNSSWTPKNPAASSRTSGAGPATCFRFALWTIFWLATIFR